MSDRRGRPGALNIELEHFKRTVLQHYEERKELVQRNRNVALLKAQGERDRAQFLHRACLQPPSQVRLINCHATCEENHVVLVDWCVDPQVHEFAAISHTFGMEVYGVFDCECTTKCFTKVPRCSHQPCPGHAAAADPRDRVVKDILSMCAILRNAGVQYAWHDGVCIAQHNNEEVEDTIKHIGWIYSYAKETIIFLHYVGQPMAPIRPDRDFESRWQTRVWTLQEAALSKCRRYCLRVGTSGVAMTFSDCKNLHQLEDKVASLYRDDSSRIAVIEEEAYWEIIMELYTVILPLCTAADDQATFTIKPWRWAACIDQWVQTLIHTCFQFPTVAVALDMCSARDSKHEGDRINSILALAGVKDFVAPKDGNMEASTIEFFKRQGQQGLARALFTANVGALDARHIHSDDGTPVHRHTWVPILSSSLKTVYEFAKDSSSDENVEGLVITSSVESFLKLTVLDDGKLELRGKMVCIGVNFTYHRTARDEQDTTGMPLQSAAGKYKPSGTLVVMHRPNAGADVDAACASIAMHLTFGMEGFNAALAQASSLVLGTEVVPLMLSHEVDTERAKPMKPARMQSCFRAASRWVSQLLGKVGRIALPCYAHSGHDRTQAAEQHTSTEVPLNDAALQRYAVEAAASIVSDGTLARACSSMEAGWMQALVPPAAGREHVAGDQTPRSHEHELTRVPAVTLGNAVFPILSSGGLGPLIQAREIQDGESFCTHMVLPLAPLLQHAAFTASRPPSQIPFWDWRVPAVLVQGDLNAPVAKVGCFHLTKELKDICTVLLPALACVDKLIIA